MNSRKFSIFWALGAIGLWSTMAAVIGNVLHLATAANLMFWSFLFATPTTSIYDVIRGKLFRGVVKGSPKIILLGLLGIFGWSAGLFLR